MFIGAHGGLNGAYRNVTYRIRAHGLHNLLRAVRFRSDEQAQVIVERPEFRYKKWMVFHDRWERDRFDLAVSSATNWDGWPAISIVMPTYNTKHDFLRSAIESVVRQSYPKWQLCIADDASTDLHIPRLLEQYSRADSRIKVVHRAENGHICRASNSALALVEHEYTALLDHDDEIHPMALFEVAAAIRKYPQAGIFFSDEDKLNNDNQRIDPYFKCDFNYELFLSQNMVSHLGVYRTDLIRRIGGFRPGFEGSQDWDLALRVIEQISPDQVIHIPLVLYHWRIHRESTASSIDAKPYALVAAKRALTEHVARIGIQVDFAAAPEAPMMFRPRFAVPKPAPSVELIIPTRDHADVLRTCIDSVFSKSTYPNYRVCIVDNGSRDTETLELLERYRRDPRVRVLRDGRPFNFSALNNVAVRTSYADLVCLLNDDTKVISTDWLEEMVSLAARSEVGCVGARLWYPDDTLQHGGVIVGLGGVAGPAHHRIARGRPGYFGRAGLMQELSAVTAACLMVSRRIYTQLDGMDERLTFALNDVDFCLRVREAGFRNVWTPFAQLYHHESVTRGDDFSGERAEHYERDRQFVRDRWSAMLQCDPFYSRNLTLFNHSFQIADPNERPPAAA